MESYGFTPRPRNAKKRRGEGLYDDYLDGDDIGCDDAEEEIEQEDEDE